MVQSAEVEEFGLGHPVGQTSDLTTGPPREDHEAGCRTASFCSSSEHVTAAGTIRSWPVVALCRLLTWQVDGSGGCSLCSFWRWPFQFRFRITCELTWSFGLNFRFWLNLFGLASRLRFRLCRSYLVVRACVCMRASVYLVFWRRSRRCT